MNNSLNIYRFKVLKVISIFTILLFGACVPISKKEFELKVASTDIDSAVRRFCVRLWDLRFENNFGRYEGCKISKSSDSSEWIYLPILRYALKSEIGIQIRVNYKREIVDVIFGESGVKKFSQEGRGMLEQVALIIKEIEEHPTGIPKIEGHPTQK